jgi:hypothetical protein
MSRGEEERPDENPTTQEQQNIATNGLEKKTSPEKASAEPCEDTTWVIVGIEQLSIACVYDVRWFEWPSSGHFGDR